jgi:hypothetical protein
LHPKFYSPIFFWDVESSSNYAEKLKLMGIAATTLFTVVNFFLVPIFKRIPMH